MVDGGRKMRKGKKLLFFFLSSFRAAPAVHRGSHARDPIGAVAAALQHSHSNATSEPSLQPTRQLTVTPDL